MNNNTLTQYLLNKLRKKILKIISKNKEVPYELQKEYTELYLKLNSDPPNNIKDNEEEKIINFNIDAGKVNIPNNINELEKISLLKKIGMR
jgi:hypothetical protein